MASTTFLCSRVSSRLDFDSPACTSALTFFLRSICVLETFSHTACCDIPLRAAILSPLLARQFIELLNCPAASLPRWVQRPASTQKEANGSLPDLGGTIESKAIVR